MQDAVLAYKTRKLTKIILKQTSHHKHVRHARAWPLVTPKKLHMSGCFLESTVPKRLYSNYVFIFFPCSIDATGTHDEWMVCGIVAGFFVCYIFYIPI